MKLSLISLIALILTGSISRADTLSSPAVQNAFRIGVNPTQGYLASAPQLIAFDAAGNLYMAGALVGIITAPNKTAFGSPDGRDIFVIKVSPAHQLIYVAQIGGSDSEFLAAMAVDRDGNVYLSGTTSSSNFPTTAGAIRSESAVGGSFVLKLDPTGGKLLYSTLIAPFSTATCLAIDAAGNAYVGGWSDYPTFPTTAGAYQQQGLPNRHAGFLSKISPDGTKLVFSTRLSGSTGPDTITAVTVDAADVISVAGMAGSPDFPTTPGANTTTTGNPDPYPSCPAFIARFDATATHLLYSTLLPMDQDVELIALDAQRNLYIAGDRRGGYPSKMYLTKVDAGGQLVYAKQVGGSGYQATTSLLVLGDGTAMLGGFTNSPDFPTRDSMQHCNPNESWNVGVLVAVDPAGNVTHASLLGGSDDVLVTGLARDPAGVTYVAGITTSSNFPIAQDILPSSAAFPTWLYAFQFDLSHIERGRPAATCLVHAALYQPTPVIGGMVETIFGSNLGPADGVNFSPGDDGRVPTEISGIRVTVDDVPAPIMYVSDTQINLVTPNQLGSTPNVCVSVAGVESCLSAQTTTSLSPGVFAVLNEDGTVNSGANPAPRGSVISVFGTGMGPYNTDVPAGSIASDPPALLIAIATATFDDQTYCEPFSFCNKRYFPADITYAGEGPGLVAAVNLMKIRIPTNAITGSLGLTIILMPPGAPNLFGRTATVVAVK